IQNEIARYRLPKGPSEFRQYDISEAFIYVSEVDLQKSEVWSFLPPIVDKEVKSARREQIRTFVKNTLTKGPKGLVAEFRQIPKYEDLSKMTEFVEQLAYGRNRYRDVGCFDDNRVILTLGHTTYIHANYVSTPSHPRKFVCTQFLLPNHLSLFMQGPLPHTCAEFWCMVVQEEADVILMLCNFTEMVRYCFYSQPILIDSRAPIIVHCSAGIGRTGSIVLLQYAMEVLARGEQLRSMSQYLEEIRTQRSNSIQNEQQYLYVHQVLLNFLHKTGCLPQSLDLALETFKKNYHKITKGF
ncbi:Protein-tyrosine phosphatase, partial [Cooperia oncophora]